MKCILVACLAAFAVASVNGIFLKGSSGGSGDVLVNLCGNYYGNLGLSLNGVLNAVGGLLKELLSIVGIVINTVLGLVGGILQTLLGGLLGGGSINKNISLDQFLTAPKSKGAYLDYLLRLVISYQAVIDKACPGLGAVWMRAVYISLAVAVSADADSYSGSKLFKPLKGDLSSWLQKLKFDQCQSDFDLVLEKNGGWDGLIGVKKVIFQAVSDILGGISGVVEGGLDAVGGVVGLAGVVVKVVIQSVGVVVYLLANLLNDVGDALEDVLQAIFGVVGSFGILGNGDIDTCKSYIVDTCGQYDHSYYSKVFVSA
ncbi:uncharacterized protein LOC126379557 [Pectinophora gossypiella]|uniref:uncharacterized protein LOC126379557 n=1 Tax=Pectinophora gossypiella TaxID=13191 RepID=UPI00214DFE42|nr:uncharacterized protein LOC126379557 [Pectinophora gossypiella]